jgi:hypothetical protein
MHEFISAIVMVNLFFTVSRYKTLIDRPCTFNSANDT